MKMANSPYKDPVVVKVSANLDKDMDKARVGRIIYYIFGAIDVLLLLQLVLKLTGANPDSGFVNFIYSVAGIFHAPFAGIFRSAETDGSMTTAAPDPSIIVAMIVYALVAYGLVKFLVTSSKRPDQVEQGL